MENQILEIGKSYNVDSNRKGKFQMKLTNQNETWATGTILKGTADAILDYNKVEVGEEVTVKKSLTKFSDIVVYVEDPILTQRAKRLWDTSHTS